MDKNTNIKPGMVVQLSSCDEPKFKDCCMTVTEVRNWGVIGYITVPGRYVEESDQVYYRATWEEMEIVDNEK